MLATAIPGLATGHGGVYLVARGAGGESSPVPDTSALQQARRVEAARVAVWAERIVAGEVKALEALMDAYALSLTRFAASIVSSMPVAEEIVQDVFVRVWDHRAALDPSGNVIGYLYRAVRNRALNVAQQERTRSVAEAEASAWRPVDTENRAVDTLSAEELREEIAVALGTVAPRCREIFFMLLEGHMSYDETAAAIGISTRSVQNQYYKAVAALATHFNRHSAR